MRYELKNITKYYNGEPILQNYSCNFDDNKFYCMMGKSGVGKTTLIRIILGLTKPDSGELIGFSNKNFSVVFQDERLLEWYTALRNVVVVMHKNNNAQDIARLLLKELLLEEDSITKKVSELSGGMRQRVCLARALACEYDILVLDEPFKGLDEITKQYAMDTVKKRTQNKCVILITHDPQEASYLGIEEGNILKFN